MSGEMTGAPPTRPGELRVPERPPVWPGVIGIIMIVLGSLATLGALGGAAWPFIAERLGVMFSGMMPDGEDPFAFMGPYMVPMLLVNLALAGTGVLAIVGGVRLCQRRRSALVLCNTWAILKITLGTVMSVMNGMMQSAQMESMSSSAGGGPPATAVSALVVFSIVFGIVWASILPVFVMSWINTGKRVRQVRSWE